MAIALVNHELSEEATLESFRVDVVNFKGDTSYPTGGSIGVSAALGFRRILALIILSHSGYVTDYDPGTDKLKVYQQPSVATAGAMPEVPNTTNLSGAIFRALVIGT